MNLAMREKDAQRFIDWAMARIDELEGELLVEQSMNEWRRKRIAELEKRCGETEEPLGYDEIMETLEAVANE